MPTKPTCNPLAPPAPQLYPTREAAVRRRWKELEPRIIIEARRLQRIHPDSFAEIMSEFSRIHRVRLSDLEYQHIPWTTIRRNDLDDPTIHDSVFQFSLAAAVRRRKHLLGCGQGFAYTQKRQRKGATP